MDPVSAAIIGAVAAGATAGLAEVTKTAIADSYKAFQALLKRKFGEQGEVIKAADSFESNPNSTGRRQTLIEEVTAVKAAQDADVLAAARALLEMLQATPAGAQVYNNVIGDHNFIFGGGDNQVTINYSGNPDEEKKK